MPTYPITVSISREPLWLFEGQLFRLFSCTHTHANKTKKKNCISFSCTPASCRKVKRSFKEKGKVHTVLQREASVGQFPKDGCPLVITLGYRTKALSGALCSPWLIWMPLIAAWVLWVPLWNTQSSQAMRHHSWSWSPLPGTATWSSASPHHWGVSLLGSRNSSTLCHPFVALATKTPRAAKWTDTSIVDCFGGKYPCSYSVLHVR